MILTSVKTSRDNGYAEKAAQTLELSEPTSISGSRVRLGCGFSPGHRYLGDAGTHSGMGIVRR